MIIFLTSLWFACSEAPVKATNSPPEITISSHSDNSIFSEGEVVTFRAVVSDIDEESNNLRTSWYMNNTLACDWSNADSNGIAECGVTMTIGVTQINVTVKDSEDSATMASLSVQVVPAGTDTGTQSDTGGLDDTQTPSNLAPVVFIVTPENGDTFQANEAIDFRGLTYDYQDAAETLAIEWSSDQTGTIDIMSADIDGNIRVQSTLPVGTHQISLSVTDSDGLSTVKTNTINIVELDLPSVQCQILNPNDGDTIIIGNSGNLLYMDAFIGSSGPIADLAYNLSSNLDGWLSSGSIASDGSVSWSGGTSLSAANHTFTLDVSYMGQSVCSDTIQVTIEQPVLTITHKNVFVTSQSHSGDFGGLTGADAFCQNLALTAGLSGTYKAWLSDTTGSPSTRFAPASVPYRLVDGTTIANDWNDLTDGTIQTPINLDEYGNAVSSSMVFSFTMTDGTAGLFQNSTSNCYGDDCHCNNWTNSNGQGSPTPGSAVGQTTQIDDDWTDYSFYNGCGPTGQPIYCFEQ